MPKIFNLLGQVYGQLAVREAGPITDRGNAQWFCDCACGNESVLVRADLLRAGRKTDCGCVARAQRAALPRNPKNQRNPKIQTDPPGLPILKAWLSGQV